MAHNNQFDFRLKVDILELDLESKSKSKLMAISSDAPSSSSSSQFSSATSIAAPKITRPVATVTDYAIRTLDTFEIEPNDVEYRAEGNANIVLALPQRCQVLRLPKQQRPQRLFAIFFFVFFFFLSFCRPIQVTKSKLYTNTQTDKNTRTRCQKY